MPAGRNRAFLIATSVALVLWVAFLIAMALRS
jgi:hypothetical protein